MIILRYNGIVLLCCLFLLAGCTSTLEGPAFRPISDRPQDKAVLYVFWPDRRIGTQFTIKANDNQVGTLINGGYLPYIVEPGEIILTSKVQFKYGATGVLDAAMAPTTDFKLNVEGGKNYFVRCRTDYEIVPRLSDPILQQVQKLTMNVETGDYPGITKCKLVK